MADTDDEVKTSKPKKTVSRTVCYLLIIITLLVGGLAGYLYGKNKATSDTEEALQKQVTQLESDLNEAKSTATGKVEEGQQSVESLQAENASLKATVDQQTQKIADLEKQLEEANSSTGQQ